MRLHKSLHKGEMRIWLGNVMEAFTEGSLSQAGQLISSSLGWDYTIIHRGDRFELGIS